MKKVLPLDIHDQPLAIINARRAFAEQTVLLEAKCDGILRSPTRTLAMPSVVRLRYYVNVPQRQAHGSRRNVFTGITTLVNNISG